MKKFAFILFVSLIISCDQDDGPAPNNGPELFRLVVDKSYSTTGSGDWLIVHDQEGNLIYSSRFESGDTIYARPSIAPSVERLSITFFATAASTPRTYELQSYTDIDVGSQWVLTKISENIPFMTPQGTYTLSALNIPVNATLWESTKFGASAIFEPVPDIPYSFKGTFTRYSQSSHLVFVRDRDNNLRYKFFEDVAANENLSFTYDDLAVPETNIDVNVNGYNQIFLTISGFESESDKNFSGYGVGSAYWDQPRSSIRLGYLDRLKYYRTSLTLRHYLHEVVYEKAGSPPSAINFPEKPEATFHNLNAVAFSASIDQPFQYRHSYWIYQPQNTPVTIIRWDVYSPANEQKLMEFPKEITDLFPSLTLNRMTHINTTFVHSGSTYGDIVETRFKGREQRSEYEMYSSVFW